METLGELRRPQFSEELAWLPGWIQHQVEQFDEHIDESPSSSKPESKVSALFQGNIFKGNDVVLVSKEESGLNNHHLFLSGEDNSSSFFTSSSRNVLQFHLRLSSDGFSQCVPSQFLSSDACQTLSKPDKVLSLHNIETSVVVKEKTWSKTSFSPGGLNFLPQCYGPEHYPNYPSNRKDSARNCGEKLSRTCLKGAEINDAVELSIAASEALVIHELAKSKSELDTTAITDAVEVSLRLKQTRLEWLGDALSFSMDDSDENDSLSNLDDFAMIDAFEDVGLLCSPFDEHVSDSKFSCVKETPASENHTASASDSGYMNPFPQKVKFDDVSAQGKSENVLNSDGILGKDLWSVSLSDEKQNKICDDPISSPSATNMVREDDQSALLKDPLVTDGERFQIAGSAMEDITSTQPPMKENNVISDSNLGNTREDMKIFRLSERFRSRWLGGWTEKVAVNAPPQFDQNNARGILKAFTCETSFLSESADMAPDENSLVQIPEIQSHGESQSSRAIEGLPDKENMEILFSQDVVRSSSLSLDDPLCSVVPCSISLENTNSTQSQYHNNTETDFERYFRPVAELKMGSSSNISSPDVEFQFGDGKLIHIVEVSEGTVRKHMTSLKTYSTSVPNTVSISDGSLRYNPLCQPQFSWEHFSSHKNIQCIRASDTCNSTECPSGKENAELCEAGENINRIKSLVKKNASNPEAASDGDDLPVHSLKARKQSLLLNSRVRRVIQASKPSIVNSSSGEPPKKSAGVEDVTTLQQSEKSRKIRSARKNSHDRHSPVRKRVRLSEADAQIKPSTDVLQPDSSKRICSTSTVSKNLTYVDKWSDYQTCETSFLKCCSSIRKGCMLQGMQFLLTGISSPKANDVKGQIQKHGGIILSDIPSPSNIRGDRFSRSDWYQLPIILSSKKQQTAKFLYGCAVNAYILHVDWLTNSIQSGSVLSPEKYLILPRAQIGNISKQVFNDDNNCIFGSLGIMLDGKRRFCTKLAKIVKHGGGRVFKTLQWLVQSLDKGKLSMGAIVTEDENTSSRHLKQCALEWQIPMMPSSWIVKSLYSGKLLPLTE